ncbi:MAG TPA: protein-tyrosine phosphatase family protein [Xanthobacteraceae bacterium]|nr:protein-tyrosine phosphatase family protein [Xanthobacteraceae bacterium]
MIHVCSLADLSATVAATGAQHILTVMGQVSKVERPASVLPTNHLLISMDDITEPTEGFVAPQIEHIEQVLTFVRGWDRSRPMVVHCFAGISRSTASAFTAACALNPNRDEMEIALQMRRASPTAYPNRRIVTLADQVLQRNGRMVAALDAMGPGDLTVIGRPFRVDIE